VPTKKIQRKEKGESLQKEGKFEKDLLERGSKNRQRREREKGEKEVPIPQDIQRDFRANENQTQSCRSEGE